MEGPSSTRYKPAPEVSSHGLDGDVVIVHIETGQYFTLRGLGLWLWEAIDSDSGCSVSEMVSDLVTRYPKAARRIPKDVETFVQALLAQKLIAPC